MQKRGVATMGIYLNPSNIGFERAVRSQIYVDKSELIAYTNSVLNTEQQYVCVSRPRRFGKSMAAKMLSAYYCRTCDSHELFANLKISQHPSYKEHLNQYDVIFLNMQQFLTRSESVEQMMTYLQKVVIEELREQYGVCVNEDVTHLATTLEGIYKRTGRSFIFVIDEWDCIFREKKNDFTAQNAYLDFLRDLLKDQMYVKLVYMTGILPIKKYGTHSALNMFDEYSMIAPMDLAEYTGFTENEVKTLCDEYRMNFQEMKRWYDGYMFYNTEHIYNPKSVVDALRKKQFDSYWTQTETYEALKVYIDMNFEGLRDDIVRMLSGGRCKIEAKTFTNDMTTFHTKDDILTLLIHLGYLAYDSERKEVFIPNEEVSMEFVRAITVSGWQEVVKSLNASQQLLEDTLQGNAEAVAKGLDMVHTEAASALTYNNENSLACAITLAYYSAREYYTMVRELPAGKGFADIVFVPRRNYPEKTAIIVELKWDKTAEGAIAQIKEKQYVDALKDYEGQILLVGINYDKDTKEHQCVIERYVK